MPHAARLVATSLFIIAAASAAWAAPAKKPVQQKGSDLSANRLAIEGYISGLNAPADWMTNSDFWLGLSNLAPAGLNAGKTVIQFGQDSIAQQMQTGADNTALVVQWGNGNEANQVQSGSSNQAHAVQISPGASLSGRRPNAGGGNGTEVDLSGLELDPGASGGRNRSPEGAALAGEAFGSGNVADQFQTGNFNTAWAVQIGRANKARQEQNGAQNTSMLVQLGANHDAQLHQRGTSNSAVQIQVGRQMMSSVNQTGANNVAIILQR